LIFAICGKSSKIIDKGNAARSGNSGFLIMEKQFRAKLAKHAKKIFKDLFYSKSGLDWPSFATFAPLRE
jgi:hypothetical protein